jgi:dolichol kinase
MDFLNNHSIRRKLVHFMLGITFIIIINFLAINLQLFFLFSLICAIILSIYTKYRKPRLIYSFLCLFDKPEDLERFPGKGAVYYLIGILLAVTFFERNIASAAIMILAVGDPAAHFIGRYYGRTKLLVNRKKLLEGTLAGIFFGMLGALLFVPFPIAFFGAAFGMIAEAIELELFNLDDNLLIPIVSGIVMEALFFLML